MMTQTIKIAPSNSLVYASDVQGGVDPDPALVAKQASITATGSSVAICCLAEMDGETEITLGPVAEVGLNESPAFDGMLETPSHTVAVSTIELNILLQMTVASDVTHLKIWTNRPKEPDRIIIGVD